MKPSIAMARSSPLILALSCALLLFYPSPGGTLSLVQAEGRNKTWCVAKPSSDEATLAENLNYACSQVDCSALKSKCGACFYPDSLISHASVAMNLYFQTMGKNYWNCYFNNSALVTTTDPSFGSCVYAYNI